MQKIHICYLHHYPQCKTPSLCPMYRRPVGIDPPLVTEIADKSSIKLLQTIRKIELFHVLFVNLYYDRVLATTGFFLLIMKLYYKGEYYGAKEIKNDFAAAFQAVMWFNWLERNQRIFNVKWATEETIWRTIWRQLCFGSTA